MYFVFGGDEVIPVANIQILITGKVSGMSTGDMNFYQWNYITTTWDSLILEWNNSATDSVTRVVLNSDANHMPAGQVQIRVRNFSSATEVTLSIDQLLLEEKFSTGALGQSSWGIVIYG